MARIVITGSSDGPGALAAGARAQAWLAPSDDPAANVSGTYFCNERPREPLAAVRDHAIRDRLLAACERLTGVAYVAAGSESITR
jgi:hypothetical protein